MHQLDSWLIHRSTAYVFDGKSNMSYKEHDQISLNGADSVKKIRCKLEKIDLMRKE